MRNEEVEILTKAKELLKREMTDIMYSAWIKDLEIECIKDNTIILYAASDIQMDTINNRYRPLLINIFSSITKKDFDVSCVCESTANNREDGSSNYSVLSSNYSTINQAYNFYNFVIGKNNGLAHAASLAVSEAPAKAYNPLYLYGGSGLGKTHLMHAIANEIVKKDSTKSILYVTSETFTNEVINAIRDAKTRIF